MQEALTNTLRHGDAKHATVALRFDAEAVDVEIIDDGTASSTANGSGQGLVGMRERATAFGGRVEAGRSVDGGFRVAAWQPLAPVER